MCVESGEGRGASGAAPAARACPPRMSLSGRRWGRAEVPAESFVAVAALRVIFALLLFAVGIKRLV